MILYQYDVNRKEQIFLIMQPLRKFSIVYRLKVNHLLQSSTSLQDALSTSYFQYENCEITIQKKVKNKSAYMSILRRKRVKEEMEISVFRRKW